MIGINSLRLSMNKLQNYAYVTENVTYYIITPRQHVCIPVRKNAENCSLKKRNIGILQQIFIQIYFIRCLHDATVGETGRADQSRRPVASCKHRLRPRPHQQHCLSNIRLCCHQRQQCRSNIRHCRKNRSTCSVRQCCFDIVASMDGALRSHCPYKRFVQLE